MQPSIIQKNGYVWVNMPREGILPLTLLEENSQSFFSFVFGISPITTALNSDIFSLFPKPAGIGMTPTISKIKKMAGFGGHDILSKKSGVKVYLPEQQNTVETSVNLDQATKLFYSFPDIELRTVESEIVLEEYLNFTKLQSGASGYVNKLQNGKLYLVTEVLQIRNFSIQDVSNFQFQGEVNDQTISNCQAFFANNQNLNHMLVYNQPVPITFAIKAVKILYNNNKYTLSKTPIKSVLNTSKLDFDYMQLPFDNTFL